MSNPNSSTHTKNNTVHNQTSHNIHRTSDGYILNTFSDHSIVSKTSNSSPLTSPHDTPNPSLKHLSTSDTINKSPKAGDPRKLSVVREISHVSTEDMTEIRLELNLALDLGPYSETSTRSKSPSVTVRSVSQYAVSHHPQGGDLDRASRCTNKCSGITCVSEVDSICDISSDEEATCIAEPLLCKEMIKEREFRQ